MRTYDEISEMLVEIAPKLELAHVTAITEMASWSLGLGDDTEDAVTVDYDEQSRRRYVPILLRGISRHGIRLPRRAFRKAHG